MRAELLAACRRELQAGDRIVCALSGGGDSVALLHCLLSLREELAITVTAAHFNHCLRGEESDADEAFVRQLCAQWGVELTVGRGDPRSRTGESPEEAARNLRYAFLLQQTGIIVTAHHGDDQIETVLLHLLRGTGLKGLCGMQTRNGRIFRPMLEISRAQIEAYLTEYRLPSRFDSSNGCDDALRNRLRHHVLPILRQENPNLTETFARMTGLLRQDEAFLEEKTAEILQKSTVKNGFDCEILRNAPEVLRRRAIRQLLPVSKPAMVHVELVEQLLRRTDGSASANLPDGITAIREYGLLRFETAAVSGPIPPMVLQPDQPVHLPELTVTMHGPILLETEADQRTVFAIKADGDTPPAVTIRSRQTGDSLCLSGGTKSLKKLMIDRKVPASQRDRLPVLTDDQGIIAVYHLGCDTARQAHTGEWAWIIQFHQEERETDAGKDDEEERYAR